MKEKDLYARNPDVFGKKHSGIVEELMSLLPAGGRVLDVGAGQGRNALALAQRGFEVDAVEGHETGAVQIRERAEALGLTNLHSHHAQIEALALQPETYDAICFVNVLQFFPPTEAATLLTRLKEATKGGGYHGIIVPIEASDALMAQLQARLWSEAEIREVYADWAVESCESFETTSVATNAQGERELCKGLKVLVRKPKQAE